MKKASDIKPPEQVKESIDRLARAIDTYHTIVEKGGRLTVEQYKEIFNLKNEDFENMSAGLACELLSLGNK